MRYRVDVNQIVLIAVLFLYGGFYDWNVTIAGILVMATVLLHYIQKKPVCGRRRDLLWGIPVLLLGIQIVTSFWAVDWAENISGILRGVVILLWMYLCMQMGEEGRDRILKSLPNLGFVITAVGLISLLFPRMRTFFWRAERFGGVFQYANTCAFFLFFCLILQTEYLGNRIFRYTGREIPGTICDNQAEREGKGLRKRERLAVLILGVLVLGMVLTGSRSVLLLFFLWGIYKCVKNRWFRKPFFACAALLLAAGAVYAGITGSYQNIGRIFTLTTANSTMYGRLLYLSDAVRMIMKHPLGLGYLGYSYMQGAEQTGVYTVRFVHNDFIQLALDYGVVAPILLIIYLGVQFRKGRQSRIKKELLAVLCMASVVDFHLQYLSLWMAAILCLDLEEGVIHKKRKEIRENYFFLAAGMAVMLYFTIPFTALYFDRPKTALLFFPSYTEAQLAQMKKADSAGEAVAMADAVLAHNPYAADAYDYKAYAAAMEGDYDAACEYKDQVIRLRRYDVSAYKLYDELLEDMIRQCSVEETAEHLRERQRELPGQLRELESITSPLAFRTRDVPEFEWREDGEGININR